MDLSPEDGLLIEQVGLAFLGEAGLQRADPAAAQRRRIGEGEGAGRTGRVLMDGERGMSPPSFRYSSRSAVPGPLGATRKTARSGRGSEEHTAELQATMRTSYA